MMKKKLYMIKISLMFVLIITCFFSFNQVVFAEEPYDAATGMHNIAGQQSAFLDRAGEGVYGTSGGVSNAPLDSSLSFYLGTYVQAFITMIGVIFTIIIMYASFTWILAGGKQEEVAKAKDYLRNGVIGLVIALSAYAIVEFFLSRFAEALNRQ